MQSTTSKTSTEYLISEKQATLQKQHERYLGKMESFSEHFNLSNIKITQKIQLVTAITINNNNNNNNNNKK